MTNRFHSPLVTTIDAVDVSFASVSVQRVYVILAAIAFHLQGRPIPLRSIPRDPPVQPVPYPSVFSEKALEDIPADIQLRI